MAKTNTAEDTVRRYMLLIENPAQLVDEAAVAKAREAVALATDPIAKLKAIAVVDSLVNIDEAPIRAGFVEVAKQWAEKENIPVSVFRGMEVPDDVLRAAGFEVPVATSKKAKSNGAGTRQRAKAVGQDAIREFVLGLKDAFILVDIQNGIGGSQATVRAAIDQLMTDGLVEKLGPAVDYTGPGRAPNQYQVVKGGAKATPTEAPTGS